MSEKSSKSKPEVLKSIVTMALKHEISSQEISKALRVSEKKKNSTESIMKLFAYLGGIFIFSGVCIYLITFWPTMNSAMKILITFGTGIVLYLLAIGLPLYNKKNEQMLSPLILSSAFFQTAGLFVTLHEFKDGIDPRIASSLIFGVMLIQQLLTFMRIRRPTLIFTSLFFWCTFFVSLLDLLQADEKTISIAVGLSLLCIAYGLDKLNYKAIANFWYFIASILFLNGLFDALKNSWLEIFFVVVSGLMLYLSTFIKNRILLFISTISLFAYIGYFTNKHFINSTAWPLLLIISGCLCIGIGTLVLKLNKKYLSHIE